MKKCPILKHDANSSSGTFPYDVRYCMEGDCAWYDGKQCAILSIMKALERIANQGVKH